MTLPSKTVEEPRKYRLIVRSAEEAVRLIREKLGDQARVTSVRQVGGEGLKRFISSPKLEVIAEVGEKREDEDLSRLAVSQPDLPDLEKVAQNADGASIASTKDSLVSKEVGGSISLDSDNGESEPDRLDRILARSGFDASLLVRLKSWSNWTEIMNLPLADSLKEITKGLADRLGAKTEKALSTSVGLVGSPGVGKTTTLCKLLAHEVFINKRVPNVLKIENGIPNPDDALRIFCEVIGVTLHREVDNCPVATDQNPLYVDVPGLSLSEPQDWEKADQTLDKKNIHSRILVVNGAYDPQILSRSLSLSNHAKATHLAITHFDELSNCTKLWPFLLDSSLLAFCVCNGQNVTGDFSTGVINQLIARTFPRELYNQGLFSHQRAS